MTDDIIADVDITVYSTTRYCWFAKWEADPMGDPGDIFQPTFTKGGAVRKATRQLQGSVNRRARKLDSRTRKQKTTEHHVVHVDVTKLREAESRGR